MPSSQTMSYKYNADGIRTQKTFTDNAVKYYYKHDYIVDGANIVAETINYVTYTGINTTEVLYYYYDESGAPTGLKYNNNVYYFQKNLQGDIIRILNTQGSIVATYTYDAWGNIIASTDTSGVSIGTKNPFRYRGYYYDTETGLYYLNSRYYDPQVGRFISADSFVSTGQGLLGSNMFAYCGNNPVTRIDKHGALFTEIALLILGVGLLFTLSSCSAEQGNTEADEKFISGKPFVKYETYDDAVSALINKVDQKSKAKGYSVEYAGGVYQYTSDEDGDGIYDDNYYYISSVPSIDSSSNSYLPSTLFQKNQIILATVHSHPRPDETPFSEHDVNPQRPYIQIVVDPIGDVYILEKDAVDYSVFEKKHISDYK